MALEDSGCRWEWTSVVVDGSGGQWLSMGVEVSSCRWEWRSVVVYGSGGQ